MSTQDENREVPHIAAFDPFPKPNTIPSGWDVSTFFAAPLVAPVTEEEDSTEN
jgi:hypothetical protein